MEKSNPRLVEVSFIIIEYHSIKEVLECIKSIENNCKGFQYEIIISSNSLYNDAKQKELRLKHPRIKWSFNKKNNGFAYGMNCGVSISKGDFIILQNPDTSIQTENLKDVLNFMTNDKTIGLIGPQILNDKGEVQDSTRKFMTPSILFYRIFNRILFKKNSILDENFNYDKIQNVNWIIGAYMITSREALNKVGLLNEKFFMYVEDMDWCLRFWAMNLKVMYYPLLKIRYEGDRKSTNGKFLRINKYTFHHVKNYFSFLKQHGFKKIKRLSNLSG